MEFLKHNAFTNLIRAYGNIHSRGDKPDIFLFSTPRSGSSWVSNLLLSQPGMKSCSEPFNIRYDYTKNYLQIDDWKELYTEQMPYQAHKFLEALIEGKAETSFHNLFPFKRYHRFITNRTVFKIIHAFEDKINWFSYKYGGQIVYLIRHPIAVSLSRAEYPRLSTFVESDYKRHFTHKQIDLARKIMNAGLKLERGILDWCFQNAIPLKEMKDNWLFITYEQLVMNPQLVIEEMTKRLYLEKPNLIFAGLNQSSGSHSDRETERYIKSRSKLSDRSRLVSKWREKVNEQDAEKAMRILEQFDIDIYSHNDLYPDEKYLINQDT